MNDDTQVAGIIVNDSTDDELAMGDLDIQPCL
jgi:hypothetical protein